MLNGTLSGGCTRAVPAALALVAGFGLAWLAWLDWLASGAGGCRCAHTHGLPLPHTPTHTLPALPARPPACLSACPGCSHGAHAVLPAGELPDAGGGAGARGAAALHDGNRLHPFQVSLQAARHACLLCCLLPRVAWHALASCPALNTRHCSAHS